MNHFTERELELNNRIQELEAEIKSLKSQQFYTQSSTIKAFAEMDELSKSAEKTVGEYFSTEKSKKAKEKAEASDRAKSEFLANISHELRTPLNTIIGYSEMLKTYLSDNRATEYLSFIDLSSRHLIRIVDDLLDLSKIEAGQLLIDVDIIKIREFFYQLANDAKIISAEKWENLNFEFKVTDNCPDEIYTDKIRLQQVLYNLLSNAIKFTEKGTVKVICDKQDDENLIFCVIDSGIGIDKDRFEEIFEIFRQGDGTFSRKFGGSGLGLSICKKLVELLGGKIWLKSMPYTGSEFYFSMPITNKIYKRKSSQHRNKIEENVQVVKVLLAEDNMMNRKLLELILKKAGHEVVPAADGFELLKIFEENSDANLIITDLQMPGMSGIEVVQILRNKEGKSKEIPIIALTAHAMQEDMINALEAGCDAYLTKPTSPALILSKIQELIKK